MPVNPAPSSTSTRPVAPPPPVSTPGFTNLIPVIRPSEFAATVKKGRVVIEFFSPACGFCRAAEPEVKKVANAFGTKVAIRKVNLLDPEGMRLGRKYGVSNFPTFAVFENGKHVGTFARQGSNPVTASFVARNIASIYE